MLGFPGTEVNNLYWSYQKSQDFAISNENLLETRDNPSISISTSLAKGQPSQTKLSQYLVTINSVNYGVKLDNGIWKLLGGTSIPGMTFTYGTSYTFDFTIYETEIGGNTDYQLIITASYDNITIDVFSASIGANSYSVYVGVSASNGYIHDAFISSTANLGNELYANNAAEGGLTQGVFAVKFNRETEMKSADVTQIEQAYSDGLLGLVADYQSEVWCGEPGLDWYPCYLEGGQGGYNYPYDDEFIDALYILNGIDLRLPALNWFDMWFTDLLVDTGGNWTTMSFSTDFDGQKYWYYYSEDLVSLNTKVFVEGSANDEFELFMMDENGNVISSWDESSFNPSITITGLDPKGFHFFYLRVAHNSGTSKLRLSFEPVDLTYNYAYIDRYSGDSGTLIMTSTYTGDPRYTSLPISKNNVSLVIFRQDENGGYESPIFDPLYKSTDDKYYLTKMLAMGRLPQTNNIGIGNPITAATYGKAEGIGEKLVGGSKYWKMTDGMETSYGQVNAISNRFNLAEASSYLASFTVLARINGEQQIILKTADDSTLSLYYNGEEEYLPSSTSISGLEKTYSFNQFFLGSAPTSFIIKIQTRDTTPFLEIQLPGFGASDGRTGIYTLVDDIEELVYFNLISDRVQTIVLGDGMASTSANDKMMASLPPDARSSMQQAVDTNPTENRVFDVNLLLEKITADFTNIRNLVKSKIYSALTWTVGYGSLSYRETKLSRFVWDVVNDLGFESVERIIDWFDNEERKDNLAKLILNDDALRDAFNYDDQGDPNAPLNYMAVAKAGILLFADYIHKRIISGGPSWVQTTWDWLMGLINKPGWTLVNVVGAIWSVASTTIGAVKSVANDVLDGIKAGVKYLLDTILIPIIDGFVSTLILYVKTIGEIIKIMLDNEIPVTLTSNGIDMDGLLIEVYRKNYDLILNFNGVEFPISTIFLIPVFNEPEFLSPGYDQATNDQIVATVHQLAFFLLNVLGLSKQSEGQSLQSRPQSSLRKQTTSPANNLLVEGTFLSLASVGLYIYSLVKNINFAKSVNTGSMSSDDKEDYFKAMSIYWIFSFFGYLFPIKAGLSVAKNAIPVTLTNIILQSTNWGAGIAYLNVIAQILISGTSISGLLNDKSAIASIFIGLTQGAIYTTMGLIAASYTGDGKRVVNTFRADFALALLSLVMGVINTWFYFKYN